MIPSNDKWETDALQMFSIYFPPGPRAPCVISTMSEELQVRKKLDGGHFLSNGGKKPADLSLVLQLLPGGISFSWAAGNC